jgi:tRNA threonylcarbamoyladenosine modification (KEOPS) complex  Pcc1 subunit
MKKPLFFLLILFSFCFTIANAQSPTVLTPGDISITGFNAGNGDIAFVSWIDLNPDTKINFTDNGWLSSEPTTTANNARNLEEIVTWTNTTGATIVAGTTIVIQTAAPYTTNYGSTTVFSNSGASSPNLQLKGGDQITVYQTNSTGTGFSPDNSATATFTGTALGIVTWPFDWQTSGGISNSSTYLPSDLSANSTLFMSDYLDPYLQYVGARSNLSIAEYKALLNNVTDNWYNEWEVPMNATPFSLTAASSNADLSDLAISSGTLAPAFASGTTTYTASVENTVTSITVTPTVADATATVTVNGTAVTSGSASGAIPLNVGDNTITVAVTAQDGTTVKTYIITVTRAQSNADLSDLVLSSGTLTPVFASGTRTYTASVANNTTSITVTPTVADATATVTVNGTAVTSGSASGAIPLNVGDNTITVEVTAEDGATVNDYEITVTRAQSSNADLSGLVLSSGTLTPVFASGTTAYTATVANNTTSVTVTPTVADPAATVSVNETAATSGSASDAILLNIGDNTITVEVTAEDGTIKTYTITVTRRIKNASTPNMTASSDLGISNTDNITSNTTPVFVGTSDPNATISLYDGNLQIASAVANSTGNWTITATTLANGTHMMQSKASLNGVQSALSSALSVQIDTDAPSVTSISRLNPDTATTDANTVTYRVTFTEKAGRVAVNNFTLTRSGTVTGDITSVSADAGNIIDVTVSNISGEGNLRLDINNNSGITDVAGNLLAGGYTTGEEYTIVPAGTLPVTLTEFKASVRGKAVEVTWKAIAEVNIAKYEVERSNAGTNFSKAGEIIAKGNGSANIDYSWADNNPGNGNNFYRLRIIDKDGSIKYSEIKGVNFSNRSETIRVSPNPVANKTLQFTLGNIAAGKYQLALFDLKGQKVFSAIILHDGGSSTKRIQLPSFMTQGAYTLHLSNEGFQLNKAIIIK